MSYLAATQPAREAAYPALSAAVPKLNISYSAPAAKSAGAFYWQSSMGFQMDSGGSQQERQPKLQALERQKRSIRKLSKKIAEEIGNRVTSA